jgi:hypothetical protein
VDKEGGTKLDPRLCPNCGVPEYIAKQHLWLNNGDLVVKAKPENRLVFIESENLDPLFKGIEAIVGVPIERIVMAAARRAYRSYFIAFVPEEISQKIAAKEIDYTVLAAFFTDIASLMGQGVYEEVDTRFKRDDGDFDIDRIKEPFSYLLAVAAHVACIEAMTGTDQGGEFEETSPGIYISKAFPSPHAEELSKRMHYASYQHHDGDIEFEKCPVCGGPMALSANEWFPDRGVIINKYTKRRMAFFGPQMLDPVFAELEDELGEDVPQVVVEAQRRFTRSGFYTLADVSDEGDFRSQLAIRGLGNLQEIDMGKKGVSMSVLNAVLPLMLIGMIQGVFEMAFDLDSKVEWEISETGDLKVEITPA